MSTKPNFRQTLTIAAGREIYTVNRKLMQDMKLFKLNSLNIKCTKTKYPFPRKIIEAVL